MEKDVKLREFCLQLALGIEDKRKPMSASDLVKAARELEKYILDG